MKLLSGLNTLLLLLVVVGCSKTGSSDGDTSINEVVEINPLVDVKSSFDAKLSKYDSLTVEESDSTLIYTVLPDSAAYDPEKELFGEFLIEKNSLALKDLNGDGKDDAIVKYLYTPHLDNNTLIYFKVMVQKDGKLQELDEVFGGGRCEGPQLELKEIKDGVVYFSANDYAQGDPCCCPTLKSVISYKLENDKLIPLTEK